MDVNDRCHKCGIETCRGCLYAHIDSSICKTQRRVNKLISKGYTPDTDISHVATTLLLFAAKQGLIKRIDFYRIEGGSGYYRNTRIKETYWPTWAADLAAAFVNQRPQLVFENYHPDQASIGEYLRLLSKGPADPEVQSLIAYYKLELMQKQTKEGAF